MSIGNFGNVDFEVSARRVRTFDQFKRSSKARFARHDLMESKPRLQHVGADLDEISFEIRLDIALGINPEEELNKLRAILASGEDQPLMVGTQGGGLKKAGRFVLESAEETWSKVDNKGHIITATVNLKLVEFINGSGN